MDMIKIKNIWEYAEEEINEVLSEHLIFIDITGRLFADLSTYQFIVEERDKETAEKWRKWQGEIHG